MFVLGLKHIVLSVSCCLLFDVLGIHWAQMWFSCSCYSALEFLSTCKVANLTVKAELGCCLLHRSGRLIIESCVLQCETNPLDYLSCAIISTAGGATKFASLPTKILGDGVTVSSTRIEGGMKAVLTSGTLVLQRVRVIYGRTSVLFWFEVENQWRLAEALFWARSSSLPIGDFCSM